MKPGIKRSLNIYVVFLGGKDGPVGFADFVYKHIVPACFLAPSKQTFDLTDAQTVLVCIAMGNLFNVQTLLRKSYD